MSSWSPWLPLPLSLWLSLALALAVPVAAAAKEHAVAAGESLWTIARSNDCTVADLRRANALTGDLLGIGDTLEIPDCGEGGASASGKRGERPAASKKGKDSKKSKGKKGGKAKKRKEPKLGKHRLDTQRLAALMAQRGFSPPGGFKALVVEFTLDRGERTVIRERSFDWRDTSDDTGDWNPASTIKFFAAVGALELLNARGFSPTAMATFFDHDGQNKSKHRVSDLVTDALVASDNLAYNRLVQLAGYDRLNGVVLSKRRGMDGSGIHKPYERGRWVPMTGLETFRQAPRIVIKQGKKVRTVGARTSAKEWNCPHSGACTSLHDLAENMRRLMLHEQIPVGERHKLGLRELRVIRQGLEQKRKRGMEFARAVESAFKPGQIHVYHKPGFAADWYSDCLYIYKYRSRRRWIVAAAGHSGRDSLTRAGKIIGEILANEEL